jgi:hypothetical protein
VRSEINTIAAEQAGQVRSGANHLTGITVFNPVSTIPVENLLGVLGDIDLRHGFYSASPPYSEIEVFGAEATDDVRASLHEYGFVEFEATAEGFVTRKNEQEQRT